MKFNFRLFVKSMIFNIIFLIVSMVVSTILGRSILLTIAYAIFGEEKGVAAATVIMKITSIIIILTH